MPQMVPYEYMNMYMSELLMMLLMLWSLKNNEMKIWMSKKMMSMYMMKSKEW